MPPHKFGYPWNEANRLRLVELKVRAEEKGRGHRSKWVEIVRGMHNESDLVGKKFVKLCSTQFDTLYLAFKEFKRSGRHPPRLTGELIKKFEEYHRRLPASPPGVRASKGKVKRGPGAKKKNSKSAAWTRKDEGLKKTKDTVKPKASTRQHSHAITISDSEPSSDANPKGRLESKSSTKQDSLDLSISGSEPSSGDDDSDADSGMKEGDIKRRNHVASASTRRKEADDSSKETDTSSQEDSEDVHEVDFDKVEEELRGLKAWFKDEVVPLGRKVLARLKAYGLRPDMAQRNGRNGENLQPGEPDDNFNKLIDEASQKSIHLAIQAQFQQARANILKEVKETTARMSMSVLKKRKRGS